MQDAWWKDLLQHMRAKYPAGPLKSWGIPFRATKARAIVATAKSGDVVIPLTGQADFLCLLHEWRQLPPDIHRDQPREGRVVGEYEITYADGTKHVQPIRGRFEVAMEESPGPCWLAVGFEMHRPMNPTEIPPDGQWGWTQHGTTITKGEPLVYALPNPRRDKALASMTIRCLTQSPFATSIAGIVWPWPAGRTR